MKHRLRNKKYDSITWNHNTDIYEKHNNHHQETVSDVIICKDKYDVDEALPHDFSLEKCGITGPEATLLYDYVPFTYPLIGWFGLSSLIISYTYLKLNYLFDGPYQRVGKSSSFRTTFFSFLFFLSFPRLSLSCSCFWGLEVKPKMSVLTSSETRPSLSPASSTSWR